MASHYLSRDYIPKTRANTYRKHSSRTIGEVSRERELALIEAANRRHALTKTAEQERGVTLRKVIAAIEKAPFDAARRPVGRQHITRPQSVKPERRYNNA